MSRYVDHRAKVPKKPHVLRSFYLFGAVAKVPVVKLLGSLLANIKEAMSLKRKH